MIFQLSITGPSSIHERNYHKAFFLPGELRSNNFVFEILTFFNPLCGFLHGAALFSEHFQLIIKSFMK